MRKHNSFVQSVLHIMMWPMVWKKHTMRTHTTRQSRKAFMLYVGKSANRCPSTVQSLSNSVQGASKRWPSHVRVYATTSIPKTHYALRAAVQALSNRCPILSKGRPNAGQAMSEPMLQQEYQKRTTQALYACGHGTCETHCDQSCNIGWRWKYCDGCRQASLTPLPK